jgi:catechol 2,3-dioxygenase-like lactoylglutathione lyase family enzyme
MSVATRALQALRPFHLAIPVPSIPEARGFYGGVLGLEEGRSTETWIDYNMWGHQLVVHLNPNHRVRSTVRMVIRQLSYYDTSHTFSLTLIPLTLSFLSRGMIRTPYLAMWMIMKCRSLTLVWF